jgi:hypothetical protein
LVVRLNFCDADRDKKGRGYRCRRPRPAEQGLVGVVGGAFTGITGFGVGVLRVGHLVLRRVPVCVAAPPAGMLSLGPRTGGTGPARMPAPGYRASAAADGKPGAELVRAQRGKHPGW